MGKSILPLSDSQIRHAKPRDKEYSLYDGDGLMVRIRPNGTKAFLFNYTHPHTSKRKNLSLGSYPDLTLSQARELRRENRALLAQGIDPKKHRDEQAHAQVEKHRQTLEHIANLWLELKKEQVTADYHLDITRSLKRHIFPNIGQVPISQITAPQTIETLKPLQTSGNFETIKRLCQRLNEIMTYAVNAGIIHSNPLSGIAKAFPPPKKQHLPTLKPQELPTLIQTLAKAQIKLVTRCLIEWQLHTMVRPNEAAGTQWDEIDLNQALWTIPANRMKNKRPHTVPLTPQAIAILNTLRPYSGQYQYVFPSLKTHTKHINSQSANAALKRMGFKNQLVAHGLRALASTILNEHGFDPDLIESALAHIDSNEVRSAYNRAQYIERRRVMMNWWSNTIETASTGNLSIANTGLHPTELFATYGHNDENTGIQTNNLQQKTSLTHQMAHRNSRN